MPIDAAVAADPERFMRLAIDAARAAEAAGDLPIGAVAVRDGDVIATAGNRRAIDQDPTAHAELLVLREAAIERFRQQKKVTIRLTPITAQGTLPAPT